MAGQPPLRIIHCFRSPVGGIFRHVRDLAEAHANAGHDVGILCDSTTGGSYEDALFDGIRPFLTLGLTRLPIRRAVVPGDIGTIWNSYKEIRRLQPDILHGHGAKGGALARLIGSALRVNRYRVARLYSPHGGTLHYDNRSASGWSLLRLERLQERLTDALVFVCDYERDTYAAKLGNPTVRSERIYNGIADQEFEAVPPRLDAADFLYLGMLRDLKGPDVFIDAFARTERLLERPLSALMVGDGPDRDKYASTIIQRGLGHRLALLPAMKARDAFALARHVVIPSRAESMPYVVLEALAAEKPVIASRVGGIPEVLGRDSAALCEPGNAEALSQVMANALQEPDWAPRTMPHPAAFKGRFSASVMAESVLNLYTELASGVHPVNAKQPI